MGKDKSVWILGTVYINPDDKRLLVPLPSKLGWAVNMGHPRSANLLWWLLVAILLGTLLVPIVIHPTLLTRAPGDPVWLVECWLIALVMIRLNGTFHWTDYRTLHLAGFGLAAASLGFGVQALVNGPLVLWWGLKHLSGLQQLTLGSVCGIAQTFGKWGALVLLLKSTPAGDTRSRIVQGLLVGLGFAVVEVCMIGVPAIWNQIPLSPLSLWERASATLFHIYSGGLVALAIAVRRFWPILLCIVLHALMDSVAVGLAAPLRWNLTGMESFFSAAAVVTWIAFLLSATQFTRTIQENESPTT